MSWSPSSLLLYTTNHPTTLSGVPWNFSRGRSTTSQLPKTVCDYKYINYTLTRYQIIICVILQGFPLVVSVSNSKDSLEPKYRKFIYLPYIHIHSKYYLTKFDFKWLEFWCWKLLKHIRFDVIYVYYNLKNFNSQPFDFILQILLNQELLTLLLLADKF